MQLDNLTRAADINRDLPAGLHSFQAVYVTGHGLDYCRESFVALSFADADDKARSLFRNAADSIARDTVTGFRLEQW